MDARLETARITKKNTSAWGDKSVPQDEATNLTPSIGAARQGILVSVALPGGKATEIG
jgi:hypothetical protein